MSDGYNTYPVFLNLLGQDVKRSYAGGWAFVQSKFFWNMQPREPLLLYIYKNRPKS